MTSPLEMLATLGAQRKFDDLRPRINDLGTFVDRALAAPKVSHEAKDEKVYTLYPLGGGIYTTKKPEGFKEPKVYTLRNGETTTNLKVKQRDVQRGLAPTRNREGGKFAAKEKFVPYPPRKPAEADA